MRQILEFIIARIHYLWQDSWFRITGSEVSVSNGDDSVIVVV